MDVRNPANLQNCPREDVIKYYFLSGFSYKEILCFLDCYHGIHITLRQLHRLLRKQSLFRRKNKSSVNSMLQFINNEVQGSGSSFGYRMMHHRLRKNGYTIDRESVRLALKIIDPEGVELRSRHRLKRRIYSSVGPNYTWHLDGYDKLKPYGFPIHAAIDGYSRKLLWLRVSSTNNDPKVIASYYMECINNFRFVPRLIRTDRGSENVVIAGIQRFLRRSSGDSFQGHKSFMFGTSTANQRIESWWSFFRRSRTNWWMNFFKDLIDTGSFDGSLNYHVECLRFCFMGVLQKELDDTMVQWNTHRIRKVRNSECPGGRPDVLYFSGNHSGGRDCKYEIYTSDISLAESYCTPPPLFGCSNEFVDLANILMTENNLAWPSTAMEAKALFECLIEKIDSILI